MTQNQAYHWNDEQGERGNVREAVGVFQSEEEMQEAVDDFESSGFNHAAFSRPVSPDKIYEATHHPLNDIREIEDDPTIPRENFIDPGSISTLRAVLIFLPLYILAVSAIVYGTATEWQAVGSIFSFMIILTLGLASSIYLVWRLTNKHDRRIRREKALGGLLLWVRTGNEYQDHKAMKILKSHGARDVHLHGPAMQS